MGGNLPRANISDAISKIVQTVDALRHGLLCAQQLQCASQLSYSRLSRLTDKEQLTKLAYWRALSETNGRNLPPIVDFTEARMYLRSSAHFCFPQRLRRLSSFVPFEQLPPMTTTALRIASRESPLAMVQSEWAAAQLRMFHPGLEVSIIGMTTKGDQILDKPLAQIGGKGLFIKELEVAIEEDRADIAVHSMKDVPMVMPSGFSLITVGLREDICDAFVSNKYGSLDELPAGAIIGTSSLRRESQIRHFFPALNIAPLRGNVNTRLRKLDDGEFDAVILAAAGLKRLGFGARIRNTLDTNRFIPAVAQGALGIEYATDRADVPRLLAPFINPATKAMVDAERAFGRRLSASCDVPLGAMATVEGARLSLSGFVATPDGSRRIAAVETGPVADADAIGGTLAERLLADGAEGILASLHNLAGRTLAPPIGTV